jgi:hypothetical protein
MAWKSGQVLRLYRVRCLEGATVRSGPQLVGDGTPEGTDPTRDSEVGAPPKRINHKGG